MSSGDFYTGEIKSFGFNFAPQGWAQCNGQLLAVSSNDALFSLIGTIYGGDGRTTFGLPDLRGRLSLHQGSGPGLTPRSIGHKGGVERVTLITQQLPNHDHVAMGSTSAGDQTSVKASVPAVTPKHVYKNAAPQVPMESDMIGQTGGNQSHDNIQPYLAINWCINLFGVYPSRS